LLSKNVAGELPPAEAAIPLCQERVDPHGRFQ
jgi:hypothetical protein